MGTASCFDFLQGHEIEFVHQLLGPPKREREWVCVCDRFWPSFKKPKHMFSHLLGPNFEARGHCCELFAHMLGQPSLALIVVMWKNRAPKGRGGKRASTEPEEEPGDEPEQAESGARPSASADARRPERKAAVAPPSGPPAVVDDSFKIVLVGDAGVGKTCISQRYRHQLTSAPDDPASDEDDSAEKDDAAGGGFRDFTPPPIGVAYGRRHQWVSSPKGGPRAHLVDMQLWDTAGQEQFHALVPMYFREAHAVIVVADCCNLRSLLSVERWRDEARRYAPESAAIFLAVNKADIPESEWAFTRQQAKDKAASLGGVAVLRTSAGHPAEDVYFVSAKSGSNIRRLFRDVAEVCYEQVHPGSLGGREPTSGGNGPRSLRGADLMGEAAHSSPQRQQRNGSGCPGGITCGK